MSGKKILHGVAKVNWAFFPCCFERNEKFFSRVLYFKLEKHFESYLTNTLVKSSFFFLADPTDPEPEPECEAACSSDVERLSRQVQSNTDDVTYLTQDVPTVLANTFTTVNNLEQLVASLQAEVQRLTRMVEDHDDRFMCLAGGMEKEE